MRSFLEQKSRRLTLLWCVLCCASLASAFIVGISDNLPGLTLCYIAAISLILAFVHTWRKVKPFLLLFAASLVGFVVFVVLHNLFYAFEQLASAIIILKQLLGFLHAVFFLIAILLSPAAALVGLIGSLITAIAYFHKRRTTPTPKNQ